MHKPRVRQWGAVAGRVGGFSFQAQSEAMGSSCGAESAASAFYRKDQGNGEQWWAESAASAFYRKDRSSRPRNLYQANDTLMPVMQNLGNDLSIQRNRRCKAQASRYLGKRPNF